MNAGQAGGTTEKRYDLVQRVADRFEPVSLAEMGRVALLKRMDTKYVMSVPQLCRALERLADRYRILEIDGTRLNRYQTLYFDTADFGLYRRHHSGGLNRYKLRYRRYVDSDLCFLEVKFKTNKRRTVKSRRRMPAVATDLAAGAGDFVRAYSPYDPADVGPTLWNSFWRMTLVSKQRVERLTIDLNLSFFHHDQTLAWPGVVIAEVKQPKFTVESDFVQMMRQQGLQPRGFGKYCMGISQLYPGLVPTNRFKPNLLLVERLMQGGECNDRVH